MTRPTLFRYMLLAVPLLLLAACSDDPVDPAPGDQFTTSTIYSSEYINNRFFKLDQPDEEANGRVLGERIRLDSIRLYRLIGGGAPTDGEVLNMAGYVDSTGFRDWESIDEADPHTYGLRWRPFWGFRFMLDFMGGLIAIDLTESASDQDVFVCSYEITDAAGNIVARIGDNVEVDAPTAEIPGQDNPYYRMKLLKAQADDMDPHVFGYVLRNIYSLGSSNIDHAAFDLRIEENDLNNDRPNLDEQGYDYFRIFGLDKENTKGQPGADGVVDFHDPILFDFARGLLKFPVDFPHPFAATQEQYEANVQSDAWVWDEESFLAGKRSWAIYDPGTLPGDYDQYRNFRIVVTTRDCPP